MMDEITLDEVNAAIKKYMQTDNLEIAMVTSDADGMKAALAAGAPSPVDLPEGPTPAAEIARPRTSSSSAGR